MPEQPGDQLSSDGQPFTGAHPTNREFVGDCARGALPGARKTACMSSSAGRTAARCA